MVTKLTVVAGDFEGYLHFFSNVDGELVARTRLGGKAVSSAPFVAANRLFVQSDSGKLYAFGVVEPKREPGRAPDVADEDADEDA